MLFTVYYSPCTLVTLHLPSLGSQRGSTRKLAPSHTWLVRTYGSEYEVKSAKLKKGIPRLTTRVIDKVRENTKMHSRVQSRLTSRLLCLRAFATRS